MASYLTDELPGTGGILKQSPEDFQVDEIPLYQPCGEGEHLYLEIEKRGVTTHDVVRHLARGCRIQERDIGYAGLKDAQALTRQTVSIPADRESRLEKLDIPGTTILSRKRHGNKLRLGHLAGNLFRIKIHNVEPDAAKRAREILDVLQHKGVPNLFGDQRYGLLGNNPMVGGAILRGDAQEAIAALLGSSEKVKNARWREGLELYHAGDLVGALRTLPKGCRNERSIIRALADGKSPQQAMHALPRSILRLFLSAWQSRLFDRLVLQRLHHLGQLEEGDLAYKHVNGACFLVENPGDEQARSDAFEISPTAPLFGAKTSLAGGLPGQRERELLATENLPDKAFKLGKGLSLQGERRPLRIPLKDIQVSVHDDSLQVAFSLPRGSFATTVMREIMKKETATCDDTQEG